VSTVKCVFGILAEMIPFRKHIAIVDVAMVLLFMGQGEPQLPQEERLNFTRQPIQFNHYGWNISIYQMFSSWAKSNNKQKNGD